MEARSITSKIAPGTFHSTTASKTVLQADLASA